MKNAQQIVRSLKRYKPEKIILFGSFAWGKPSASSDVDVLVIKKSKLPKRFRTTQAEKFLSKLPYPVDVLVYTPKELEEREKMGDFFINLILKKGQVLYEKK
ncbi:MAG: nucleotidyltransferase domain-containing protein [Patescibacteria group bacterium]|nr:nucleotidyltransferase domain-containing protein [Patescibacteria group bacterium]